MESEITESQMNDDRCDANETADEQVSRESLLTSMSSVSMTSEILNADELVIEVQNEEPDYKSMYEEYKRLLDVKTEMLRDELSKFDEENKKKQDDYNNILKAYREMEDSKKVSVEELKKNTDVIEALKNLRGKTEATQLHLNRKADELFKAKARKRTGSMTNITTGSNKCEYSDCGVEDTELVRCSICSRYVCETCNEIPVGKLKSVVKACSRIYFLCKEYHRNCDDAEVESFMVEVKTSTENKKCDEIRRLKKTLESKLKIIATMEQVQKSSDSLFADKDEMIKNHKEIIQTLKTTAEKNTSAADLRR